ncbi:hypothetical protein DFQ28_011714 [Apophysomyces sp. BC1034]|nr:hypothetical protein DFQ30_000354 [Apophysomyces sp. BC1015]KAG0184138.1 hypothetical protein DFQ28_011714 [Apophysomyces sp. BC1034]
MPGHPARYPPNDTLGYAGHTDYRAMKTTRLSTSDLYISPIGLGTWAIGGPSWAFGWGAQCDTESQATLERAIEHGVNWIDTAAVYGLGHAEETLGKFLRRVPIARRPLVFTKGSLTWDADQRIYHSLDPASLTREVENSLRRLGIEAIDLYQIHWPAFPCRGPDHGIEAALSTLDQLRNAGKIREIGVCNFDVAQLKRARSIVNITALQSPYSILTRDIETDTLAFCKQADISILSYSTLQSGLLTGAMTRERAASLPHDDWRSHSPDFQEPKLTRHLLLVDVLRQIGQRHGLPPCAVAIGWALRQPAVTGVIAGARHPSQIDDWLGATRLRLSENELAEIARLLPDCQRRAKLTSGSNGLIGSALRQALQKRGTTVKGVDIDHPPHHPEYGDIRDIQLIKNLVADCDGIIHLAAVSRVIFGENNPKLCWSVNVDGTRNFIEALKDCAQKPWIIYASSREVYGQQTILPVTENSPLSPLNIYARSKVAAEEIIQKYREEEGRTATLRFSSVYGSVYDYPDRVMPAFCRAAALGETIMIEGNNNILDFTHINDTIGGILKVVDTLEAGRFDLPTMHLTTGRATTLLQAAQLAQSFSQYSLEFSQAPSRTFDVSRFYGDPGLAQQELGWRAQTTLEEGMAQFILQFQNQVRLKVS